MPSEYGAELPLVRVNGSVRQPESDWIAIEEPLEIRVSLNSGDADIVHPVSVTMRTPGADAELAAGFLYTERIVERATQIECIQPFGPATNAAGQNTVVVRLRSDVTVNLRRLKRNFYAASSCGVCGKASIEAVRVHVPFIDAASLKIAPRIIHQLPDVVRRSQPAFDATGGLHAAAMFTPGGELIAIREDVGRHNALDKLIGSQFLAGRSMSNSLVLVSGRAGFELVQKAAVAGIPLLAAVGAPSSLAAELAIECNMTLVGFVRDHRFNIYCGAERIAEHA